jgi:hypothetical protein
MERTKRHLDSEDAADAAIDRAVREIMSAEPRPGFRRRVLDRLAENRRPAWSVPRLGFGAAAAAAVVLALFMWTRPADRTSHTAVVRNAVAPAVPPSGTRPDRAPDKAAPHRAVAPGSAQGVEGGPTDADPRLVQAASIETGDVLQEVSQIDALPSQPPLVVQSLQAPEPTMSDIVVDAITVGDISLSPLEPAGR